MEINNETKNKLTFQSENISLISFLLTQGVSLVEIQEDRPNHFIFILSDPNKCNELKQLYLNNASAPARELFSNREILISEIKTRDRNENKYANTR